MDEWHPLYWSVIGAVAAYLLLFLLAARPVSLRCSKLGGLLLTIPALRAVMIFAGSPLEPGVDGSLAVVAALFVLTRSWTGRLWIIHTTADDFWNHVETACRGLFLKCELQSETQCVLQAGGKSARVTTKSLGEQFQFVCLPAAGVHGKFTLLVDWLAKQYPGPVPPVRIVLKRR